LLKDRPPLYNRFLLSFKGYDIKNEEERWKQVHSEWEKHNFYLPYSNRYTNVRDGEREKCNEGIKKADGSYDEILTPLPANRDISLRVTDFIELKDDFYVPGNAELYLDNNPIPGECAASAPNEGVRE